MLWSLQTTFTGVAAILFIITLSSANSFVVHGTSQCTSGHNTICNAQPVPVPLEGQSQEASSSQASSITKIMPIVPNFRPAAGLKRIYRCANTDKLGNLFPNTIADNSKEEDDALFQREAQDKNSPEYVLLYNAGLILDLRSKSERNETKAQTWMSKSPGGKIFTKYFSREAQSQSNYNVADTNERIVYRIDVLCPKRLFDYLAENWLTTPVQKAQYAFSMAFDTTKLHEMRMDVLNGRGIQGTYEAMLQTSGEELFAALKAITEYLESNDSGDVVVHCVKGKDRTGLVIMLCQSILSIDDVTIVQDYHKSEKLLNIGKEPSSSVSTVAKTQIKGQLNRNFFSGSPEEAMISTLALLREKYGSLHSYLDFIGFDSSWRKRFQSVMSEDGGGENMDFIQSKL